MWQLLSAQLLQALTPFLRDGRGLRVFGVTLCPFFNPIAMSYMIAIFSMHQHKQEHSTHSTENKHIHVWVKCVVLLQFPNFYLQSDSTGFWGKPPISSLVSVLEKESIPRLHAFNNLLENYNQFYELIIGHIDKCCVLCGCKIVLTNFWKVLSNHCLFTFAIVWTQTCIKYSRLMTSSYNSRRMC